MADPITIDIGSNMVILNVVSGIILALIVGGFGRITKAKDEMIDKIDKIEDKLVDLSKEVVRLDATQKAIEKNLAMIQAQFAEHMSIEHTH